MRGDKVQRGIAIARDLGRSLWFRAIICATLINFGLVFAVYSPNYNKKEETAKATDQNRARPPSLFPEKTPEERTADYTFWLTAETFVLAVSTVGLWIVTWRGAAGQARDMKESITTGKIASEAALKSAEVAEKTLIASQRPWISCEITPTTPIIFNERGMCFDGEVVMKNFGPAPAINVWVSTDAHVLRPGPEYMGKNFQNFCDQTPLMDRGFGIYIFPGDERKQEVGFQIGRNEIASGLIFENRFAAFLYICVSYEIPFISGFRKTGLIVKVEKVVIRDYIEKWVMMHNDGETVPLSQIRLVKYQFGGHILT